MAISLYDYQLDAVERMATGSILCGGVGSGKSRTSLAYYYIQEGGEIDSDPNNRTRSNSRMRENPRDLYIITTARKRDTGEWESELTPFLLSTDPNLNSYKNTVTIDSWNNISKYATVQGAFFIFDEQRVVGSGAWVKAFLKIAKANDWILLSATPGDTWSDYIPVFVANGFYKNRTEFTREHIVYSRFSKFPKVERYLNTGRLIRLRNKILVDMDFKRQTVSHHLDIWTEYPALEYKALMKTRWNSEKQEPIATAGELCLALRKIVNSDPSRLAAVIDIMEEKKRAIIFYNFDYELELLHKTFDNSKYEVAEWNGHKHQPIPETDIWVYLVQYTAGAEGWNCIRTDTIIFYSQNYSYKIMAQSAGRIDRLNTPYTDLYYYHLKSRSSIDIAIMKAINAKKNFNEGKFVGAT